ncbi:HIR complex subunit [Pestalotiopsis sp. IQ-011]
MSHKSSIDHHDADLKFSPDHVEQAPAVIQIETFRVLGLSPADADFYNNYGEEKRKKLTRKVDLRLIPMLAFLYLICHIDRANIGNAKIEGMVEDLNMTGVQYNIVLAIFFIPYVLFEIPSNILLKKFKRPSAYIAIITTAWGMIMTCTGLVRNFGSLMAVRILLGIFDAAAIAEMDGIGGLEGWRWIFILEGLVTVVIGICCRFLLIDSPALSTRWLDQEEIRYLELSMFIKQGGNFQSEKHFRWTDLKMAAKNWRIYMQAYFLFVQSALSYGTKFTLPTICQAMGFTDTYAQLMSAPPYVAAAISAITFAKLSDKFYWRMPFVAIPTLICAVGYAIFLGLNGALATQRGLAYFAAIIVCIGIYPIQPAAAAWNANNIAPETRRVIAIAMNNCVGNTGGIVGSFMYIDSEKPKYHTGFGLGLALATTGLLMAFVLEWSYKRGNAQKAEMTEDQVRAKYTEAELMDMGDSSPLFRYVL